MIAKSHLMVFVGLLVPTVTFAQGPPHLWSQRFGDQSNQAVARVAVDPADNVVITGAFKGELDFGGGALTSAGGLDIYVAKFTSDGEPLWSRRFGGATSDEALGLAVDADGNVIVVGQFTTSVDFGGGLLTSEGNYDIFIAKYAPDGQHVWSERFGSDMGVDRASAVAVDNAGNIVVTGLFDSWVDFGGGLLPQGDRDVFLVKFSSDGSHIWSYGFGDDNDWQYPLDVAVDMSGNAVIVGQFQSIMDFGGGPLASEGGLDVFVAKFGVDGEHIWSDRYGDTDEDMAGAVAVDQVGNVFLVGHFRRSIDFGGGALWASGETDAFLAKLNANGNYIWAQKYGDMYNQEAHGVAITASGDAVIVGHAEGNIDFGGGAMTSAGYFDLFVAGISTNGNCLWSRRFGDWPNQYGADVAVDGTDATLVAGYFDGSVDFGDGALSSAGGDDVYVAKFGYGPVHVQVQNVIVQQRSSALQVSWTLSENVDVAGFQVLRMQEPKAGFQELAVHPRSGTAGTYQFDDAGVSPGEIYIYRVDVVTGGERRFLFETTPVEVHSIGVALEPNYPNPFNPSTTIPYSVPSEQFVRIAVYDAQGRHIRTLDRGIRSAGVHRVTWDGRDSDGMPAASGVYFAKLESELPTQTRKLVLLK